MRYQLQRSLDFRPANLGSSPAVSHESDESSVTSERSSGQIAAVRSQSKVSLYTWVAYVRAFLTKDCYIDRCCFSYEAVATTIRRPFHCFIKGH